LDERGLCRIILHLGEDYLCDICREHPRFYHRTPHGMEVGLGMACEEACRIILSSDEYATFLPIDTLEDDEPLCSFDATAVRACIYANLSDQSIPYAERLRAISDTFDASPSRYSDEEIRALLASLEYLDPKHKTLFSAYTSVPTLAVGVEPLLERALAYFIFRHCSTAYDESELRASLGFCLLCERLLASLLQAATVRDMEDAVLFARMISEELEYSEENTERIRLMFFER
jgi:lysine-N-methylase